MEKKKQKPFTDPIESLHNNPEYTLMYILSISLFQ